MREIEYIVGIYNYFNPYPEESHDEYYYMLYLLDEKGLLDKEGATKLFTERFLASSLASHPAPGNAIGPFMSLETLNQYAFALCEDLNAAQVSLLSVQEYNSLLENSQQAPDFHRDLLEKGNVMENIERKKKGFLSRFFS